MTDTHFQEAIPFAGAGIIPVSRNGQGEIVLLLGKERHNVHWRGSFRWSGFEGGRKVGETMEETAVREFVEESMGCVLRDADELKERLVEKRYMARFRLMTKKEAHLSFRSEKREETRETKEEEKKEGPKDEAASSTPSSFPGADPSTLSRFCCLPVSSDDSDSTFLTPFDAQRKKKNRVHACYLIFVPFDDKIETSFSERRKALVNLQSQAERYASMRDGGEILLEEGTSFVGGKKVDTIEAVTETNKEVQICFLDEEGERHIHRVENCNDPSLGKRVDLLLDWFRLRRRLKEWIDQFDHPAISYSTNKVGMLDQVVVNEDHLEKQTVRWWPLSDLRRVIENGGCLQEECFRVYFLPMLQRIVDELKGEGSWRVAPD